MSEEVFPGFKYSVFSYVVSLLRPEIIRDLELPRFGLQLIPLECAFSPLPDGRSLCRWSDSEQTRREIEKFSKRDAEIYPAYGQAMMQMGRFVKPILSLTPPDPTSKNPAELWDLLQLGRRFALRCSEHQTGSDLRQCSGRGDRI